jgi:hypothetical protein
MRQHSNLAKDTAEKVVKDIRSARRKQYSAEEKICIVLASPNCAAARADGRDHARGGSRPSVGGGQAARDQRADDLHLAQAFRRLQASEVRRLKQLEAENARLKKLVAERDLEIEVMKEVAAKLVSVPARPIIPKRKSNPTFFLAKWLLKK